MAAQKRRIAARAIDAQPQIAKRGRPPGKKPGLTDLVSRRLLAERLSAASAAAWFNIPGARLVEPTRGEARIARARQTAIYFAHVVFRANLTRAGGIFGRDRTTARHACNSIEDRRDDLRFDKACGALEPAMRLWMQQFGGVTGERGET
jgi:Bacterial dnaA protein helix-turn-helix